MGMSSVTQAVKTANFATVNEEDDGEVRVARHVYPKGSSISMSANLRRKDTMNRLFATEEEWDE